MVSLKQDWSWSNHTGSNRLRLFIIKVKIKN